MIMVKSNEKPVPETWLSSPNVSKDILAGFIVFLLALPLSIGIAMASGFPPLSGLAAAAIGGLIVAPFAGSPMSIKGPAAGMIVIMLGAVEELGAGNNAAGVRYALAAVVVVGLIQILLGKFRLAEAGKAFPEATVNGMLAAIGVIIISKQSHVMLGHVPSSKEPLKLLAEVPRAIMECNPQVAMVGVASLLLMVLWPMITRAKGMSFLSKIPVPLVVVFVAVACSLGFDFAHAHEYTLLGATHMIGPKFLVNVPSKITEAYISPDFSLLGSGLWWKWAFMIGAVGSLESVLSVKAVDAIDPEKRHSDCSKDLMVVGFANTLCGLVGALPIIAEIVRSSANLNAGAKSRWANFFHGLFMVVFVAAFPWVINMIPLAALAGLLVFTGSRLAALSRCKAVFFAGKEQFAVFAITLVTTLATDLLVGIGVGLTCETVFNLLASGTLKHAFHPRIETTEATHAHPEKNEVTVIGVNSQLTFTNLMSTMNHLKRVKANHIVLDLTNSKFVDHTSMSAISEFKDSLVGRSMDITGLDDMHAWSSHPHSALIDKKSTFGRVITRPGRFQSNASTANPLEQTVASGPLAGPLAEDASDVGKVIL